MIKQISAAFLVAAVSGAAVAESASKMSEKEKLSYLFGHNAGQSMLSKEIDIDPKVFLKGMQDALAKKKSALSSAEINEVMVKFQTEMQAKAQKKNDAASAANIKEGKDYIQKYVKQSGVKVMDNGIAYKVIKAGNGASPKVSDKVVAHYTGKLVNGQVFDSSVQRGQPTTFPLNGVIQGWQEVLPKMKVGGKWEVVIPPQLAYGERAPGGIIGPNSTLVFEIELIEIAQ